MQTSPSAPSAPAPRSSKRWGLTLFFLFNTVLFGCLGIWQVQRLAWKQELIARVEARVHQAPVAAPSAAQWPTLTHDSAEYLRVQLQGTLLHEHEIAVYASTELGPGYWILTPLHRSDVPSGEQQLVWINRGYVPNELRRPDSRPVASEQARQAVQITGLLRLADLDNLFLRDNVPDEERWYQRDPAQFSAARGLPVAATAPYFVDSQPVAARQSVAAAEATWPRAGLTQIQFRNNHLSYAITWFVLALLNVAAVVFVHVFHASDRLRRSLGDHDAA